MQLRKNDTHDLEYWKEKYFDNLEDLERKENEWAEIESLLRHSIARLAVAGYGVNPRLDCKLDELRNTIRQNGNTVQLDELVRDISDTAARLKDPERSSYANPIGLLTKLLDGLEFPAGLRKPLKRLKQQLTSAKAGDAPKPLVDDFVKLLQQGLEISIETCSSSPNDQREARLTGGLTSFMRAFTPTLNVATDSTEEPATNSGSFPAEARVLNHILGRSEFPGDCQMELQALRQQIDKEKSSAALIDLADRVAGLLTRRVKRRDPAQTVGSASSECPLNQVLLELLLRFDVPPEMEHRVVELRGLLYDDVNTDRLPSILESIAALVTDMRRNVQRERRDIERFLKNITDRLMHLNTNLHVAERSRRDSLDDGRDLGNTLRDQVTHLRTSMAEALDLEQLQQAVKTGLDAVQKHLETYVLTEERRSLEAEKRIQELRTQLHDVTTWAGNLQDQVKQQQAQAKYDSLTSLYNRLAYDERIHQEFLRWMRYKDPLSLVVIDVDRFKSLNDNYGHQAGDKALKILARQLRTNVREVDLAARYGGEEFVIILPRANREDAIKVAEKLRRLVEKSGFHYRDQPVPITISCGVAEFRDGDTPESVFQRGDEALYQAKHEGRNRCCLEKLA